MPKVRVRRRSEESDSDDVLEYGCRRCPGGMRFTAGELKGHLDMHRREALAKQNLRRKQQSMQTKTTNVENVLPNGSEELPTSTLNEPSPMKKQRTLRSNVPVTTAAEQLETNGLREDGTSASSSSRTITAKSPSTSDKFHKQ